MGNQLISGGNIKTSILGNYIKDFMINKYEYGSEEHFKNFLKKRACCRQNVNVPISLPSVILENVITVDNDESGKKIIIPKGIYPSKINIPVFKDKNEMTKEACTFENGNDYIPTNSGAGILWKGGLSCNDFYSKFCKKVYDKRSATYDREYDKSYGIYPDNVNNNPDPLIKLSVGNEFQECNCLNSPFIKNKKPESTYSLQATQMAQTFDKRCAWKTPELSYIESYDKQDKLNLCINELNVGKLNQAEQSNLGINQNCSSTSNDIVGGQPSAQPPAQPPAPPKQQAPPPAPPPAPPAQPPAPPALAPLASAPPALAPSRLAPPINDTATSTIREDIKPSIQLWQILIIVALITIPILIYFFNLFQDGPNLDIESGVTEEFGTDLDAS